MEMYSKVVYRQTSNVRRTIVGHKIDDHSDVVGASPVGTAPTTRACILCFPSQGEAIWTQ